MKTIKRPVKLTERGLKHAITKHVEFSNLRNLERLDVPGIAYDIIYNIDQSNSFTYEIKSHETKDGNPYTIRFDENDFEWEEIAIEEEEEEIVLDKLGILDL
jgi:hypothetical protein